MLPNDDRVSKPRKGFVFPLTTTEMVNEIRQYEFKLLTNHERLDIIFQNNYVENIFGYHLSSFSPLDYIAICAVKNEIPIDTARMLIRRSIQKFSHMDEKHHEKMSHHQLLIYRVYVSESMNLRFTKCVVQAGPKKNLWRREYAKVTKSKNLKQQEGLMEEINCSG